ncbi:MAG: hypothetical protein HW376_223 [candidate division NC10 bacterium]|nr:hypothetical protein [candidate division NC10 bacterium]
MKRERQPAATRILAVSLLEVGCGPRSAPTLDSSGIVKLTPGPDPTATVQIAPPSPELSPNTATSVATPTQPAVETYIAYLQSDAVFLTHAFGGRPLDTHPIHPLRTRGWRLQYGRLTLGRVPGLRHVCHPF